MKKFSFLVLCCLLMNPVILWAQNESPAVTPEPAVSAAVEPVPVEPVPVEPIDCVKVFKETNQCPPQQCKYGCFIPAEDGGCLMACIEKACLEIKPEECPSNRCQVMISCENKQICYPKLKDDPAGCGGMGYVGQDIPCCRGFIKRCGVEFFDGTCDMYGRNSIYSVPTCVPCGNGICDQFEHSCNCPEDCERFTP